LFDTDELPNVASFYHNWQVFEQILAQLNLFGWI